MEQSNTNLFELQVDHQGTVFLREVAKWSKFLSIVGFVMMALILLVVIFAGSAMTAAFSPGGVYGTQAYSGVAMMVGVTLGMLIYFFPCLYLYRFATKMQTALRNNDQDTLNTSFSNLKSCFKFMGVLMIIIISIYGIAFLFGIIAAATSL
jgi:hypothetical protein